MTTSKPGLSLSYQKALNALNDADLGRALIHARNGLKEAELRQDFLNLSAHQGLCARIHLEDDDRDSARRALKLMKLHSDKLTGQDREWCDAEHVALSARLETKA